MSDLGITYDYQPSESAADLASMAEIVVTGNLVDVTRSESADEALTEATRSS